MGRWCKTFASFAPMSPINCCFSKSFPKSLHFSYKYAILKVEKRRRQVFFFFFVQIFNGLKKALIKRRRFWQRRLCVVICLLTFLFQSIYFENLWALAPTSDMHEVVFESYLSQMKSEAEQGKDEVYKQCIDWIFG